VSAVAAEHLDRYAAAFEGLTPNTVDSLHALVTDDVRFVDPFNDVRGPAAFVAIFRHMYETLSDVSFTVDDRAIGERAGYLRWTMAATLKRGGGRLTLVGMSEVRFAADGRVSTHIDHWDAAGQLYETVPVLGPVLRWLRRRLAAPV